MSDYSVENCIKIWNDKTGDHVYVGPDRDGLDLVDIGSILHTGNEEGRVSFTIEQAILVAKAILKLYDKGE